MPDFEDYCRCPGCGTCAAHDNQKELNSKIRAYKERLAILERLQPTWTLDVVNWLPAAALAQLWGLLKVDNQTAAVLKIEELLK
jgi:hypothetical protein